MRVIGILLFILCIIPISAKATNENVSIMKTGEEEYVIYIESTLDKKFSFALSNDKELAKEDLEFIASGFDSNYAAVKNNIAYIDSDLYKKYGLKEIYIWVKVEDKYILEAQKLNLNDSVTSEEIKSIEDATKRIKVNTDKKIDTVNKEDEVIKTLTTGAIEITDDSNSKYYYETIKLPGTEQCNQLMKLAEEMNGAYAKMNLLK